MAPAVCAPSLLSTPHRSRISGPRPRPWSGRTAARLAWGSLCWPPSSARWAHYVPVTPSHTAAALCFPSSAADAHSAPPPSGSSCSSCSGSSSRPRPVGAARWICVFAGWCRRGCRSSSCAAEWRWARRRGGRWTASCGCWAADGGSLYRLEWRHSPTRVCLAEGV
jgi:hypothetical protein